MKVQKAKITLRFLFILFFAAIVLPLAACVPSAPAAVPPTATISTATPASNIAGLPVTGSTSLTFLADADAQVDESTPDTNHGSSTTLKVDAGNDPWVESFLRFTVNGVTDRIREARVRVYSTSNASSHGAAIYATSPSWSESEITWASRPMRISGMLDSVESIGTETWVEYDISSFVNGNGTFSFVLATDGGDAATFSSRQGSQPPQLVVTFGDDSAPTQSFITETPTPSATPTRIQAAGGTTLTFLVDADAKVKQSDPYTNYGNATTLQVDGAEDPDMESFLRFTVTGVSGTIQSVYLRVYATDNGSRDGPAVYATDTEWPEFGITWSTRPDRTSDVIDNKDTVSKQSWAEYDVTSVVTGDGKYSFVLAADSNDSVVFSSRQGNQAPQLAITFKSNLTSTPTSTLPPGEVVFVGAGDISSCNSDADELTAQLLDTIPGTVFTTGDNVYSSGTAEQFAECYDPTWGRHKDRTRPVPGNHDYLTSGASAYYQYFNNVASYYAYDLGNWRIYALNSEIDVSLPSSQVVWLTSDLLANPRQCVLAYWHKPRWSSGVRHGSDPDMQTLWQILYEAGADVVINGHEHNYERFFPMNAAGEYIPSGMREFVVGTGGRDLYELGTILPTSDVQDDASFGVLKLILRSTSYDWEFVPVTGSTFSDRGSGECR